MKKNSIVKDYSNIPVSGTVYMPEKSNMLCSKMMDIEDIVRVSYNFTGADVLDELLNPPVPDPTQNTVVNSLLDISHSSAKEKAVRSLIVDKSQSKIDADNLTKWIFEFDSKSLLREYLYNEIYTLNPQSPFRTIPVEGSADGKINKLCYSYIESNILDRYRLKEFILWASYYELKNNTVPGTGTDAVLNPQIKLLYKTPVYSFNAIPSTGSSEQSIVDKQKETISMKQYNDGLYEIAYKQKKSSQYYTFVWYYDAIYERI